MATGACVTSSRRRSNNCSTHPRPSPATSDRSRSRTWQRIRSAGHGRCRRCTEQPPGADPGRQHEDAWTALVGEDEYLLSVTGELPDDVPSSWVEVVGPWTGTVVLTTGRATAAGPTRALLGGHAPRPCPTPIRAVHRGHLRGAPGRGDRMTTGTVALPAAKDVRGMLAGLVGRPVAGNPGTPDTPGRGPGHGRGGRRADRPAGGGAARGGERALRVVRHPGSPALQAGRALRPRRRGAARGRLGHAGERQPDRTSRPGCAAGRPSSWLRPVRGRGPR
jgi:hypothetical protein